MQARAAKLRFIAQFSGHLVAIGGIGPPASAQRPTILHRVFVFDPSR